MHIPNNILRLLYIKSPNRHFFSWERKKKADIVRAVIMLIVKKSGARGNEVSQKQYI